MPPTLYVHTFFYQIELNNYSDDYQSTLFIAYTLVSTPLLVHYRPDPTNADQVVYGGLIARVIILFVLPFLHVSGEIGSRFLAPVAKPSSKSQLPIILFVTGVAIYAIAFSCITFSYDLFFRRVGFAGVVERSMRIPFYGLIINRSFMENAITLTCALAFLLVLTPMPRICRLRVGRDVSALIELRAVQ